MPPETAQAVKRPVLLLGSQMATGGAQRMLLTTAAWLHHHGYPVTVAFLYDKENLHERWQAELPCPLIDLQAWNRSAGKPSLLWTLPRAAWHFYRLLRQSNFGAAAGFTHHASLFGMPLAWLAGVPARVAVHCGRILGMPLWMERLHGRMANVGVSSCIVAVSDQVEVETRREGARPEKIVLIPNGVEFRPPQPGARTRIRQSLGVSEHSCLALNVARITSQKGQDVLVRAVRTALEACPDLVIALAGDGPERPACEALAAELGVSDAIRFLGNRTDVPDLLAAADLFVLPSRSEGMPLALIEAMGAGLPVAAAAVGGVADLLGSDQYGLVVPPEEPQSLADAVVRLCADEALRKELAAAGQQRAREGYSHDVMCRRYAQLFAQLWEQGR